ncbi:MAG: radical SAM protein, partial [Bacillota bacterium]
MSHMVPLSDLVAEPGRCDAEITSYLISGGCSDQGVVPVVQSLKSVRKIGPDSGRRINMHVGLISDESDAQAIGAVADVVSFDFVGDNRAIRNVYGLERSVDDYVRSYELLASQC